MLNGEPTIWIADLKRVDETGHGMLAMNQRVVSKLEYDAVVNKLRDERALLRLALKPFAEVGAVLDVREFENLYERWGTSGKKHIISMQHLKKAAAVYGDVK